jgi:NADH:ubiquinone oxidoreductase subunit D
MTKSNPDNGPRVTTEHEKTIETEILVERGPKHPAGPGVTRITVSEPKGERK